MEVTPFSTSASITDRLGMGWCVCVPYPTVARSTAEGLLRFEDDALVLEYQQGPGDREAAQKKELPIDQVDSISLGRKLLQSVLTLRVKTLQSVTDLPGTRGGVAQLRISRADLDRARSLASRVNQRLSELELKRLDQELTKLQA